MDKNAGSFTVLFQSPFWVGVAERWDAAGYSAARVVFGPEPTDPQLYEWLLREWHRLRFSPVAEGNRPVKARKNPKRAQREARAAIQGAGLSTRAREALSRQQEQEGKVRQVQSRQAKQAAAERKYLLHQQKKHEKKRGR